jgi:hypothetical protein
MFKKTFIVGAFTALVAGCATTPTLVAHPLATALAPVTANGNVAGQATEYVFVLVADANPAVPGLALRQGDSIRLQLPAGFHRNESVAIHADTDQNLVFTKGWPQGAVRLAGQYRVDYEAGSNTVVVSALKDIPAEGANAPGIKVIHLRGRSFVNPMPGVYAVSAAWVGADGATRERWEGRLDVVEDAPPAHLAPSNFHLPPGVNADFQHVAPGQVAAYPLGVLLWGGQGGLLDGVGIAPRDLTRFPRYTGGVLVQDTNHDGRLDASTDRVVGGIIGAAPPGATGQSATSPLDGAGRPVLSGTVLRDAHYPMAMGGGRPNPGLLTIQFKAGDKPGLYRPTLELIGGNSVQFTIDVSAP